jgi:hypothetical protein
MAIQDIPVFREARRGQVLRSDDWNGVQRELRNGIRAHRHSRLASAPPNDSAGTDLALQITTDEIADGAVTAAKLAPGVLSGPSNDGPPISLAASPQATGTASLGVRGNQQVTHGLGSVPVAVVLGVQQGVSGVRGDFEVYGATSVTAAVPRTPDGTFTLVSTSDSQLTVRWWAFAAPAPAGDPRALEAPAPPAPRRRTRKGS